MDTQTVFNFLMTFLMSTLGLLSIIFFIFGTIGIAITERKNFSMDTFISVIRATLYSLVCGFLSYKLYELLYIPTIPENVLKQFFN